MKLSEVIESLETMRRHHGDVEVFLARSEAGMITIEHELAGITFKQTSPDEWKPNVSLPDRVSMS